MADFNPIKSKITLGVKHLNIKSNKDNLSEWILKTYNQAQVKSIRKSLYEH